MITPEEFLQTIHEIAAHTPADRFESEVHEMCRRLAREIQLLKETSNETDSEPNRCKTAIVGVSA